MKKIMIFTIITLVFFSCDDKPDDTNSDTITAFHKTANVKGDAAISTADFNTAVGNLQSTLTAMDTDTTLNATIRTRLTNMMGRTITIIPGNAAPVPVNNALTVGVDWLKSRSVQQIGDALANLALDGAFAD
jgi:hypothetical protein